MATFFNLGEAYGSSIYNLGLLGLFLLLIFFEFGCWKQVKKKTCLCIAIMEVLLGIQTITMGMLSIAILHSDTIWYLGVMPSQIIKFFFYCGTATPTLIAIPIFIFSIYLFYTKEKLNIATGIIALICNIQALGAFHIILQASA